jgi:hypothetical protein
MDNSKYLKAFLQQITSNAKLKRCHVSLFIALCQIWIENEFESPFKISRSELMLAAKIKSKATYHKTMHELEKQGYIRYNPTHNPFEGSSVAIILLEGRFK